MSDYAEYPGPQRSSPRVPVFCPVVFWGDPTQTDAICLNISHGGMALAVDAPVEAGTLLRVSALLPDHDPITVTAVVVWARRGYQTKIGLRFLNLAQEALKGLSEYLATVVPA